MGEIAYPIPKGIGRASLPWEGLGLNWSSKWIRKDRTYCHNDLLRRGDVHQAGRLAHRIRRTEPRILFPACDGHDEGQKVLAGAGVTSAGVSEPPLISRVRWDPGPVPASPPRRDAIEQRGEPRLGPRRPASGGAQPYCGRIALHLLLGGHRAQLRAPFAAAGTHQRNYPQGDSNRGQRSRDNGVNVS